MIGERDHDIEDRIVRTLRAKSSQLTDDAFVPTMTSPSSVRRREGLYGDRVVQRRRAWPKHPLVVLIATVLVGAGGTVAAIAASHYDQGSGVDGAPSKSQSATLATQLKDYDPAEVQYLRAQSEANDGQPVDDQGLVGTLEFRRACRVTMQAVTVVERATTGDVATKVDALMQPEVQRLVKREPSDSQAAETFQRLAEELDASDTSAVLDWLHGSCRDALAWSHRGG
jgi:hypothetical protein